MAIAPANSPSNLIEFRNRLCVIATMHRKELAIAPILETALGLRVTVPPDFDSDRFGTFTRDIDRPDSQVQTAILKAERAIELLDIDLAIASEGSFFAHPFLGIPYNREVVLLRDRQYDFTVYGVFLSTDTNFNHHQVSSYEEALQFALRVGFPEHGIVLMPAQTSAKEAIYKGITSEDQLRLSAHELLKRSTQIHIETDMRALYNPTRMRNIGEATQDLVRKLKQLCPNCNFVNFDVVEHLKGLPCELCGLPTEITRSHIYRCDRCRFKQEILFPNGNLTADPMYCSYCNP